MTRPKLSVSPGSHLIPYAQALPSQILEATITAREALEPYYPTVTWPQWHQAFRDVQPQLRLDAEHVTTTSQGLTELTRYFEARHPAVVSTPLPTTPLPHPQATESPAESLPNPSHWAKKTYSLSLEALESLNRVSFWRREGKSALVNLAVLQLMATYPESRVPIPPTEI